MTEKTQAPFRVGGCYRNRRGQVAILRAVGGGEFSVLSCPADGPRWEGDQGYARNRLSDGWSSCATNSMHPYNLLPGELHQVDGQWVAVEERSPEQKFDEAVARVRDVLEKESNDAMIARDEARSQEAKVWALQQHLNELRIRESAPKPVGPTVHAPMAALQLCADLEPRGYLR